ncbi:phosphoribosyltransferase [Streptomyces sp. NPDC014793]|uniref:phosphoribosyltransferase n=1 Tax=Streptomyces sp. NPDC014793 TaxID=3364914 RepID=UPI0036F9530A
MNTARLLDRTELPLQARQTVDDFEKEHATYFSHLVHFDPHLLESLHAPGALPDNVRVASSGDPAVIERMAEVTAVANLPEQRDADRGRYLRALLDIYGMLPVQARDRASLPETTVIAPEREGRILAESLGVLPRKRGWTPQAKRMPVAGGLLVGLDEWLPSRAARLVVVDGVVASGVTLMAILRLACEAGAEVEVFTCHSTRQGALALARYAEELEVSLTLHVGHVSGALNGKFYAVRPDAPDQVLLGDVGDTISPVASDIPPRGPRRDRA